MLTKLSFARGYLCGSEVTFVAQRLMCLPPMQETWVWSLGREDPLEKEMATHSSTLAWRIPWMEEPSRYSPRGCKELDVTEWLHFFSPLSKTLSLQSWEFRELLLGQSWECCSPNQCWGLSKIPGQGKTPRTRGQVVMNLGMVEGRQERQLTQDKFRKHWRWALRKKRQGWET